MKRLPNLIITSGDPAGIGLDLCVMLAFKKFLANITIIGNKDAILSRASKLKKNIKISTKLGSHLGNGELKIINLNYKNPVISGQLDKSNSLQQLKGLRNSIELCLDKKFDALIKKKANEVNQNVKLEFNKTKIHLNLIELNLEVKLNEPRIIIKDKKINLSKLNLFLSIKSFFSSN